MISDALWARLLTVADLPAVHQRDAVLGFKRPAPGVPWVRETVAPGGSRVDGLPAATGTEVTDGAYLIDGFFAGDDAGKALALAFADAVDAAFAPGVPNGTLATSDPAVGVQSLGASSAGVQSDGPWLFIPCMVRWRSQVPNALP